MLDGLAARVKRVYLHIDLDVHGAHSLHANGYATAGGPTPEGVRRLVRTIADRFDVAAAAITAFDPTADLDGRALVAALDLLEALASRALSS